MLGVAGEVVTFGSDLVTGDFGPDDLGDEAFFEPDLLSLFRSSLASFMLPSNKSELHEYNTATYNHKE